MVLLLLPLHRYPDLYEECAEVLNAQWSRSKTARLHSLKKSCDSLPSCLVLVCHNGNKKTVTGHSLLSRIVGVDKACLIESVVIKKQERGKGLGRKIMEESEKYAKSLGFQTMFLSTHDKQDFYRHLGYEFCSPVLKLEPITQRLSDHMISYFLGKQEPNQQPSCDGNHPNKQTCSRSSECKQNVSIVSTDQLSLQQIPTPPPLPPAAVYHEKNTGIVRLDPNAISWMKKDL